MIDLSSPPGPVRSSPRARAALTSSRTAACSASLREVVFVAFFGIELTLVIFSVIA